MPAALSDDLRACVVRWRLVEHHSIEECAERAGVTTRTVQNILRTKREHNTLRNPRRLPPGRKRLLEYEDHTYISSILSAQPTMFADELKARLATARGINVSLPTISRTIARLELSRKKVSHEALERNELLRASWQVKMGKYQPSQFVFIDEAAADDHTSQRQYGYSPVGHACVERATFLRGQRYSILPALDINGIVTMDLFEGSVNKDRFMRFLREDLAPKLQPYPHPRSVVVMDNCSIHHDEEIRQIIEVECGAILEYLPPYSPDFNPIEQAFSFVKKWLKRHEAEAINADVRPWLIHQAILAIPPSHAVGWFKNCGHL